MPASSSSSIVRRAPREMTRCVTIATGNSGDLLTRAADVCLKERRPPVLVTRETPLSLIHIRNMEAATLARATIAPPVLAFYHRPRSIDDLVDQIAGRILDQFSIAHSLSARWSGAPGSATTTSPGPGRG
jgi:polyprenyl P-hydroxybenzoate/phenylacrylic acid decarboxylase-like protein